jgi:hypothetical protein
MTAACTTYKKDFENSEKPVEKSRSRKASKNVGFLLLQRDKNYASS